MQTISSKVVSISSLTSFVYKLSLSIDSQFTFKAGQYLQVVMGEKDKRPFSIANAPNSDGLIELHIGATPENRYAFDVIEQAQNTGALDLEVGLGDAYLRESDLPAILIAGGTGYSYTKSILLHALMTQKERNITLYWGAKNQEDLYEADILHKLSEQHTNFTFVPVVEFEHKDWAGKTGLVHKAVIEDLSRFESLQVYVAGRFEMAAVVREEFAALGLDKQNLFGDAFAFI